jgi:(p)ppGpp synthase/HD superfamily hydrolase
MLSVRGFRAQMVAVLHDVLEDTDLDMNDLVGAGFPADVVAAVLALTHRPEQTYEQYIEEVARDPLARVVKLADLADNLRNNRRLARSSDVRARIARYESAIRRLRESAA